MHMAWPRRNCLFAPGSVFYHCLHQRDKMLKAGFKSESLAILEHHLGLVAVDPARKRVGDKAIGWAAARANYRQAGCGGFQHGYVESFGTVRRNIGVRHMV